MTHPALFGAEPKVLWLDDPDRPDAGAALTGNIRADLVVVGGGYTGLWTALRAIEREPGIRVVILEACGSATRLRDATAASPRPH